MQPSKNINALLTLVDDPDEEVFSIVSNELISCGKSIVPDLEDLWERSGELYAQERIENLILQLNFKEIFIDFEDWKQSGHNNLFPGVLLVNKLHDPNIHAAKALLEMEQLRRLIWLELNNYLTPFEKIKVISTILFEYKSYTALPVVYNEPGHFLLNVLLEEKKGNSLILGILYYMLARQLDIPIVPLLINNQYLLGYQKDFDNKAATENIAFFIDPQYGGVIPFSAAKAYFSSQDFELLPEHCTPLNNIELVKHLVYNYSLCYKDKNNNRFNWLQQIVVLLEN